MDHHVEEIADDFVEMQNVSRYLKLVKKLPVLHSKDNVLEQMRHPSIDHL